MSLSDEQWLFLKDVGKLIAWAEEQGYKLTGGDLYRDPRAFGRWGERMLRLASAEGDVEAVYGAAKSNHKRRLAIDLNLFVRRNGRWQYVWSSEQHRPLADYWESLSPENRSGIRYNDANHYERVLGGWR